MAGQRGCLLASTKIPKITPFKTAQVRLTCVRHERCQSFASQTIITIVHGAVREAHIRGIKIQSRGSGRLLGNVTLPGFPSGMDLRPAPLPQHAR